MKTIITIENNVVTVEVDDQSPVLVKSAIQETPVTSKVQDTSKAERSGLDTTPVTPEAHDQAAQDQQTSRLADDRVEKAVALGVAVAEHVATNGGVPVDDTQKPPSSTDSANPLPTGPARSWSTPKRYCKYCADDITDRGARAVVCLKTECKKLQQKESNEKWRAKQGMTTPKPKPSASISGPQQFVQNDATPRLAAEAPVVKGVMRSRCCEGKVEKVRVPGGVDFDRCLACMKECEAYEYFPPFVDKWDCAACREAMRPCRLHAGMEATGAKPMMRPNL